MFKMKHDPLEIVIINGEVMMGFRSMALADNRSANFGGKAIDVLGVVGVLLCKAAALRERWAAPQR